MNQTSPELEDFAWRLMEHESPGWRHEGEGLPVAVRVCQRLREPLVALAGAEGFRLLLSRALTLARKREPSLDALRVGPQGSLTIEQGHGPAGEPGASDGAGVHLIALLIGLLATFVGRSLALSIVRSAWQRLDIREFEITDGGIVIGERLRGYRALTSGIPEPWREAITPLPLPNERPPDGPR